MTAVIKLENLVCNIPAFTVHVWEALIFILSLWATLWDRLAEVTQRNIK